MAEGKEYFWQRWLKKGKEAKEAASEAHQNLINKIVDTKPKQETQSQLPYTGNTKNGKQKTPEQIAEEERLTREIAIRKGKPNKPKYNPEKLTKAERNRIAESYNAKLEAKIKTENARMKVQESEQAKRQFASLDNLYDIVSKASLNGSPVKYSLFFQDTKEMKLYPSPYEMLRAYDELIAKKAEKNARGIIFYKGEDGKRKDAPLDRNSLFYLIKKLEQKK